MKKRIAIILIICFALSLTGCTLYEKADEFLDKARDNVSTVEDKYVNFYSSIRDVTKDLDIEETDRVFDTLNLYIQDGELTKDEIEKIKVALEGVIDAKHLKRILDTLQRELQ